LRFYGLPKYSWILNRLIFKKDDQNIINLFPDLKETQEVNKCGLSLFIIKLNEKIKAFLISYCNIVWLVRSSLYYHHLLSLLPKKQKFTYLPLELNTPNDLFVNTFKIYHESKQVQKHLHAGFNDFQLDDKKSAEVSLSMYLNCKKNIMDDLLDDVNAGKIVILKNELIECLDLELRVFCVSYEDFCLELLNETIENLKIERVDSIDYYQNLIKERLEKSLV
jgi:hypothetical protein